MQKRGFEGTIDMSQNILTPLQRGGDLSRKIYFIHFVKIQQLKVDKHIEKLEDLPARFINEDCHEKKAHFTKHFLANEIRCGIYRSKFNYKI